MNVSNPLVRIIPQTGPLKPRFLDILWPPQVRLNKAHTHTHTNTFQSYRLTRLWALLRPAADSVDQWFDDVLFDC